MTQALRDTSSETRARLCNLLSQVSQGKIGVSASEIDTPLKDLGMDSVTLLSFLVAIEDTFGLEWPADVAKDVFASIASIALYVESRT